MLAAGRPLKTATDTGVVRRSFNARTRDAIRTAIKALQADYEDRGIVIAEVASGFRMQVKASMADRLHKLWEERPPRYSRALVRNPGADRLSPAYDARRDRGNTRCGGQFEHHAFPAGTRMGSRRRPSRCAGTSGHVWHDPPVSRLFWPQETRRPATPGGPVRLGKPARAA